MTCLETSVLQNQEGGGEFQGGVNVMVNFQFQKPPWEFDGRIWYLELYFWRLDYLNKMFGQILLE